MDYEEGMCATSGTKSLKGRYHASASCILHSALGAWVWWPWLTLDLEAQTHALRKAEQTVGRAWFRDDGRAIVVPWGTFILTFISKRKKLLSCVSHCYLGSLFQAAQSILPHIRNGNIGLLPGHQRLYSSSHIQNQMGTHPGTWHFGRR